MKVGVQHKSAMQRWRHKLPKLYSISSFTFFFASRLAFEFIFVTFAGDVCVCFALRIMFVKQTQVLYRRCGRLQLQDVFFRFEDVERVSDVFRESFI